MRATSFFVPFRSSWKRNGFFNPLNVRRTVYNEQFCLRYRVLLTAGLLTSQSQMKRRKPPKRVNLAVARKMRAEGHSYGEIARRLRVTAPAVYYALNPRKRKERPDATGRQRSIYMPDELWARLDARAEETEQTISQVARYLLMVGLGPAKPAAVKADDELGF